MFRVIETVEQYNTTLDELACDNIGFVPTMGNLHKGHIQLLENSLRENDISVISFFVNNVNVTLV
jgi:pantoate--beta-alanine ligase